MRNPYVIGVGFTGSSKSGASIAEVAGRHLKKAVMELGGNDPFVVLSDCNLQLAVESAVAARCVNAGQVCFSPKRFIIVEDLY
jgi:succinate-semialdehyde dehydrogenase/glutarate-semialdehyde dehydrogenase